MKKNQSAITLLLACFLFTFYSCTKSDSSSNTDSDTQSAADNSFAESTSNDAISISAQSEDNGTSGNITDSTFGFMLSPCANISIDLSTSVLTVDFGSSDCLCYDGKIRRGKIVVSYTGMYRDNGSTHTITFNNYYVNNYKVEGTTTVINKGHNERGNISFDVHVSATITDSAGNQLTYTSTRVREWVGGESTDGLIGWLDDVYSITGTAHGTDFSGNTFNSTITSPLIIALNCRWIESGKIDFTPSDKLTRHLDFGNGDCDNKMNIKIAGLSFDIYLP